MDNITNILDFKSNIEITNIRKRFYHLDQIEAWENIRAYQFAHQAPHPVSK